jgi:hypothetical protein
MRPNPTPEPVSEPIGYAQPQQFSVPSIKNPKVIKTFGLKKLPVFFIKNFTLSFAPCANHPLC